MQMKNTEVANMTTVEMIQLITNIFLIIGVAVAAVQLALNRKITRMDFDRRKKEATIAFTHEVLALVGDCIRF